MGGHGTALDEENKRVRCKYCEKVVGGFNRLKHHLGGVGSDVVECSEVPADIKEHMRNSLLEKKKERLVRQVGILDHPELPLKRSFCQLKPTQESPMEKGKRAGETVEGDYVNGKSSPHLTPPRQTSTNEGNNMKFESTFLNGHIPSSLMMEEDVKPVIKEEVRNESELLVARSVGGFFFEAGINLNMLMKKHIRGGELVRASKLKSLAQFVTLENIVSERENLITMFRSTKWIASICASRDKGKRVVEKLENTSFWIAAADILKVTNPLISVLHQICESDNAPMGFLYDAMDHSKEKIKQNFGGEETRYLPFWDIIDNVWDNFLYSTIHSAAYYLNPSLFYSDGFYVDAEVTTGLLDCIARMAKDHYVIARQLEAYRTPAGCFAEPMAVDQRTSVPPALWWSLYGGQAPELTDIAVRILSQTCCCALRYKLGRGLSEQLHAEGNCLEQQLFREMEFVHNNRYLWKCASGMEETGFICEENLNLLKDWIIEDNDKRGINSVGLDIRCSRSSEQ
ncbi:hypothetical protein ACMD2_21293 [Ananas comosus]|uniref:BED-type domain-containing protein n=1 Tax=Ananas comosus TaxID=4615 RepID=A0A199VPF2_ANACO|nr:hypothetical protein ACMD2_21293 [Ananas comosus]